MYYSWFANAKLNYAASISTRLQPIFRLEFVPTLVEGRKDRGSNESDLSTGILRKLARLLVLILIKKKGRIGTRLNLLYQDDTWRWPSYSVS
jgi:hypothetical protein